jgi:hypothetical protein
MNRQENDTDDEPDTAEAEFVNARRIIHERRKLFISPRFRARKRYKEDTESGFTTKPQRTQR